MGVVGRPAPAAAAEHGLAFPVELSVMPGLVPGIHVFAAWREDVDGRDKPGHDER